MCLRDVVGQVLHVRYPSKKKRGKPQCLFTTALCSSDNPPKGNWACSQSALCTMKGHCFPARPPPMMALPGTQRYSVRSIPPHAFASHFPLVTTQIAARTLETHRRLEGLGVEVRHLLLRRTGSSLAEAPHADRLRVKEPLAPAPSPGRASPHVRVVPPPPLPWSSGRQHQAPPPLPRRPQHRRPLEDFSSGPE